MDHLFANFVYRDIYSKGFVYSLHLDSSVSFATLLPFSYCLIILGDVHTWLQDTNHNSVKVLVLLVRNIQYCAHSLLNEAFYDAMLKKNRFIGQ